MGTEFRWVGIGGLPRCQKWDIWKSANIDKEPSEVVGGRGGTTWVQLGHFGSRAWMHFFIYVKWLIVLPMASRNAFSQMDSQVGSKQRMIGLAVPDLVFGLRRRALDWGFMMLVKFYYSGLSCFIPYIIQLFNKETVGVRSQSLCPSALYTNFPI